jgi:adenosylmethionine-8-amino-7-oxononanoate aminotransferase
VRARGTLIRSLLAERLGEHPHIGDIRGRGLFIGVEIVKDRDTREPFPAPVSGKIKTAAMAERLVCYPGSGSVDGDLGDHVLLAPPYIVSEDQAGEIVARLARAIEAVVGT